MKLHILPAVLLGSITLSACNNLEMPNSIGLTPGIAPGALSSYNSTDVNSLKAYRIASHAQNNASGGTGWCYRHVAASIHSEYETFLWGEHAYMAADQLASSKYFKEIQAPALHTLPAGAVVVWEQGTSPSGHISIATGKGFEVSDHIAPQMQSHYGGGQPRVFLPQ